MKNRNDCILKIQIILLSVGIILMTASVITFIVLWI